MTDKRINFKLAVQDRFNTEPYTIDWEAIETKVLGLYITKSIAFDENNKCIPAKKGWNVTHTSGWVINPVTLDSLPVAKNFVDWLSDMDWTKPIEYLTENFREYTKVIRFAYEKAIVEKEQKPKVETETLF